jgi:hypothetical protein
MTAEFDHLLDTLHDGSLWESYGKTLWRAVKRKLAGEGPGGAPCWLGTGGAAVPELMRRTMHGRPLASVTMPCGRPKPTSAVSVGNQGPEPETLCQVRPQPAACAGVCEAGCEHTPPPMPPEAPPRAAGEAR